MRKDDSGWNLRSTPPLSSRAWSKRFFLGLGLVLFVIVLWRTGWDTVWHSFSEIGWNYIWIILWPTVYYCFYSVGWQRIIPKTMRFGIWEIFKARIVGEAINYLTPLGNFGGEPARTVYLKEQMPLHVTAATVVIDRTLYFMATVVFTFAGVLVAYLILPLDRSMKMAAMATLIGLSVVLAAVVLAQQARALTKVVRLLAHLGIAKAWLNARVHKIEEIEKTMREFYRKRPRDFLAASLCHLAGRAGGTLEIWIILYFLGAFSPNSVWHHQTLFADLGVPTQLLVALLVAVYVIVLNTAFFMFPSQVGVAEGGTALLFQSIGFDPALGVALQIVRRVKSLFYIAFGLQAIAAKKRQND